MIRPIFLVTKAIFLFSQYSTILCKPWPKAMDRPQAIHQLKKVAGGFLFQCIDLILNNKVLVKWLQTNTLWEIKCMKRKATLITHSTLCSLWNLRFCALTEDVKGDSKASLYRLCRKTHSKLTFPWSQDVWRPAMMVRKKEIILNQWSEALKCKVIH